MLVSIAPSPNSTLLSHPNSQSALSAPPPVAHAQSPHPNTGSPISDSPLPMSTWWCPMSYSTTTTPHPHPSHSSTPTMGSMCRWRTRGLCCPGTAHRPARDAAPQSPPANLVCLPPTRSSTMTHKPKPARVHVWLGSMRIATTNASLVCPHALLAWTHKTAQPVCPTCGCTSTPVWRSALPPTTTTPMGGAHPARVLVGSVLLWTVALTVRLGTSLTTGAWMPAHVPTAPMPTPPPWPASHANHPAWPAHLLRQPAQHAGMGTCITVTFVFKTAHQACINPPSTASIAWLPVPPALLLLPAPPVSPTTSTLPPTPVWMATTAPLGPTRMPPPCSAILVPRAAQPAPIPPTAPHATPTFMCSTTTPV